MSCKLTDSHLIWGQLSLRLLIEHNLLFLHLINWRFQAHHGPPPPYGTHITCNSSNSSSKLTTERKITPYK